jgi:hypothetical protein
MSDPIRPLSTPAVSYPEQVDPELMCIDPNDATSSTTTSSAAPASAAGEPSMPLPKDEPNASMKRETPPAQAEAARALAVKFSKPSPAVAAAAGHAKGANNAERVQQTPLQAFHFDAGTTENGDYFVGAALLRGRDASSAMLAESGSISAQFGEQLEVQVSTLRFGFASDDGLNSVMVEGPSAHVSAGTHNKDGSEGYNASIGATLGAVEGTGNLRGSSATLGYTKGFAAEYSVGKRDSDGDGAVEYCGRVGAGFLTVGLCVEDPDGWTR